jgi:hypothetical protein
MGDLNSAALPVAAADALQSELGRRRPAKQL